MSDLFLDRFDLRRHPPTRDASLRAWDAGDEYLIRWLSGEQDGGPSFPEPPDGPPCWIVNDRFGALAVALASRLPLHASTSGESGRETAPITVIGDSWLALEAARMNLERAGRAATVRTVPDPELETAVGSVLRVAPTTTPSPPPVVLLRVPRALATLQDQLTRLRACLPDGAVIVGAGMTRDVHTSTVNAFETIVGPTVTSHARKKSRLLHATAEREVRVRPDPQTWSAFGIETVNLPGIFSASGLDLGTRALLETLRLDGGGAPTEGPLAGWRPASIADVGCGNGILGVAAARAFPGADLHLADDSFRAVESARRTAERTLGSDRRPILHVGDALDGVDDASVDLVLANPPFHAQGARGDDTAWRFFVGARRILASGGRLYVVGNRHLGYHVTLGRIFDRVETVGATPKFVVLEARGD